MAGTTTGGTVINFDDIRHEVVKVIKRGHTYELRDDIPMAVLVRAFALKSVGERLQALGGTLGDGTSEEDIAAVFDEASEETIPICTDIFKHTYPDMTDDDVATLFPMEERMQLIQVFFQRRLAQLNARPDATSGDTAAAALAALKEQQAQTQTANRATRRALTSSRRATSLATTQRLPR